MTVAKQIIAAVNQSGSYTSLFRLTVELGIDYSHAHAVTNNLKRQGLLVVTKTNQRGTPLRLQSCHRDVIQNADSTVHSSQDTK